MFIVPFAMVIAKKVAILRGKDAFLFGDRFA
jgi:hypothetical protein